MERRIPTVADVVRIAVEACDPDRQDPALARLEVQFEDDDEPITAVDNLEERLALAAEGADYDVDDPAVSVATAVILYLAAHRGTPDYDREPGKLIRLAVDTQWRGDPPRAVDDWVVRR
jgi:hypothetical protein